MNILNFLSSVCIFSGLFLTETVQSINCCFGRSNENKDPEDAYRASPEGATGATSTDEASGEGQEEDSGAEVLTPTSKDSFGTQTEAPTGTESGQTISVQEAEKELNEAEMELEKVIKELKTAEEEMKAKEEARKAKTEEDPEEKKKLAEEKAVMAIKKWEAAYWAMMFASKETKEETTTQMEAAKRNAAEAAKAADMTFDEAIKKAQVGKSLTEEMIKLQEAKLNVDEAEERVKERKDMLEKAKMVADAAKQSADGIATQQSVYCTGTGGTGQATGGTGTE